MSLPRPTESRTIRIWDIGIRLFHWLLVIVIAIAFLSSEEDSALSTWHVVAGWVAAILIAFRLVWGLVGGEHARFINLVRVSRIPGHVSGLLRGRVHASLGHNPLGGIAVLALLGLTAATIVTGITGGEGPHELIAWTLMAMVVLHVVAVVVMSVMTRDNLIGAMITGRKKTTHFPNAQDARPPARVAVPLAAVVIAGSAYVATRIDPHAFTPGARAEAGEQEAGEHEADED